MGAHGFHTGSGLTDGMVFFCFGIRFKFLRVSVCARGAWESSIIPRGSSSSGGPPLALPVGQLSVESRDAKVKHDSSQPVPMPLVQNKTKKHKPNKKQRDKARAGGGTKPAEAAAAKDSHYEPVVVITRPADLPGPRENQSTFGARARRRKVRESINANWHALPEEDKIYRKVMDDGLHSIIKGSQKTIDGYKQMEEVQVQLDLRQKKHEYWHARGYC